MLPYAVSLKIFAFKWIKHEITIPNRRATTVIETSSVFVSEMYENRHGSRLQDDIRIIFWIQQCTKMAGTIKSPQKKKSNVQRKLGKTCETNNSRLTIRVIIIWRHSKKYCLEPNILIVFRTERFGLRRRTRISVKFNTELNLKPIFRIQLERPFTVKIDKLV